MSADKYEWFPRPPTVRQRIVAGLVVGALVIPSLSSYAGWRLFGDHDKAVVAGVMLVGLVLFARFMPTVRRRQTDVSS